KQGAAASEATYRQLKQGSAYDASEAEVNVLGYSLLRGGRAVDAVEVFRWNAAAFPASANAYDSLGEAYLKVGKKDQAAESYRKALELDPGNVNARRALEKLK
ncbi:MAG TPA: tetratricopeptide repeat protein, partial [Haliangiales bacterium]|nr:tetratricopeptide repeat protein [Haliangiales bacterium]